MDGLEEMTFDRTYEGLKLMRSLAIYHLLASFDRTYEGLKLPAHLPVATFAPGF